MKNLLSARHHQPSAKPAVNPWGVAAALTVGVLFLVCLGSCAQTANVPSAHTQAASVASLDTQWTQTDGNAWHTRSLPKAIGPKLKVAWSVPMGDGSRPIAAIGNTLYLFRENNLSAMDLTTRTVRWSLPGEYVGNSTALDELAYALTDKGFVCLAWPPPNVTYFRDATQVLSAYSAASGVKVYSRSMPVQEVAAPLTRIGTDNFITNQSPSYDAIINATRDAAQLNVVMDWINPWENQVLKQRLLHVDVHDLRESPCPYCLTQASADGSLLVGVTWSTLFIVKDGRLTTSKRVPISNYTVAVDKGSIYLTSSTSITKLDYHLRPLWHKAVGDVPYKNDVPVSVAVAGDRAVVNNGIVIKAFDTATGKLCWSYKWDVRQVEANIAICGPYVFAMDCKGYDAKWEAQHIDIGSWINTYDVETGKLLSQWKPHRNFSYFVPSADGLYAVTSALSRRDPKKPIVPDMLVKLVTQ